MITINLFKRFHGLRAKYHEDILKSSRPGIQVIPIIVVIILVYALYVGLIRGKNIFFSYLDKLDNNDINIAGKEEPPKLGINYRINSYVEKKSTSYPDDRSQVKQTFIEEKLSLPIIPPPSLYQEEKGEDLPSFAVRVATLIIKSNALSLKNSLLRLGYTPSIKNKFITLPKYRVSYKKLKEYEVEKVKSALNGKGILFNITADGDKFQVLSEETFIKPVLISLINESKNMGISGKLIEGARKRTESYEVIAGIYSDRGAMLSALKRLKQAGFAPIWYEIK